MYIASTETRVIGMFDSVIAAAVALYTISKPLPNATSLKILSKLKKLDHEWQIWLCNVNEPATLLFESPKKIPGILSISETVDWVQK